jgi:murein DD-endopeptidase MepM/ murein hydrolase activator NlpD
MDLSETGAGQDWLQAANEALRSPVPVLPPFREEVFLPPRSVEAAAFSFRAARGQRVEINIETAVERYFADVYRIADGMTAERREEPELVASASGQGRVTFTPRRDGRYLLRIQPELLRGGRFVVNIVAKAAYAWPVPGTDTDDVWSVFGDPRAGGDRVHHGIDIFDDRGTEMVAVTDAQVMGVGRRDLGGNVVTLYDREMETFIYYAHLEEQLTLEGRSVEAGEAIGTIGNTGNAQSTLPHLHIAIYDGTFRRPVDPWYFFVSPEIDAEALGSMELSPGTTLRVSAGQVTALRHLPDEWGTEPSPAEVNYRGAELEYSREELARLPAGDSISLGEGTVLRFDGRRGGALRAQLPDGRTVYLERGEVERSDDALTTLELVRPELLREAPSTKASLIGRIPASERVALLGGFDDYVYVETERGERGWVWTPARELAELRGATVL